MSISVNKYRRYGYKFVGGDCVVGIATSYGLDGPGIKSRWGARFSAPVQTDPGEPPGLLYTEYRVIPGGKGCRGVALITHPDLAPKLQSTGLIISPSGISELECATTTTDTAERSISIGRESLQVSFVLGALSYFQVPPLGGSREEKWRSQ